MFDYYFIIDKFIYIKYYIIAIYICVLLSIIVKKIFINIEYYILGSKIILNKFIKQAKKL